MEDKAILSEGLGMTSGEVFHVDMKNGGKEGSAIYWMVIEDGTLFKILFARPFDFVSTFPIQCTREWPLTHYRCARCLKWLFMALIRISQLSMMMMMLSSPLIHLLAFI